jgi:hypothetical protein
LGCVPWLSTFKLVTYMWFIQSIWGSRSRHRVWQSMFCAQKAQMMIPPLWLFAVGWSWQMLDWFYWFYSVLQCH